MKYKCAVHGENVVVFPAKNVDVGSDGRACVLCVNKYLSNTYPVMEMKETKEEKSE